MQFRLQPFGVAPSADSLSWQGQPHTDTERTDRIMQILSASHVPSSMDWHSGMSPPDATSYDSHWATPIQGFDAEELADQRGDGTEPQSVLGGQSVHMAAAAAIPAGLQIGQAGIAALRALGPLAAATLAAILKAFHDRLGRQPTPTELDHALNEHIPQQGTTVTRDRPGAPSDKPECEDQFAVDNAYCDDLAKKYDKQTGAICGRTAMERYAECLRFGLNGVRTPLYRP